MSKGNALHAKRIYEYIFAFESTEFKINQIYDDTSYFQKLKVVFNFILFLYVDI